MQGDEIKPVKTRWPFFINCKITGTSNSGSNAQVQNSFHCPSLSQPTSEKTDCSSGIWPKRFFWSLHSFQSWYTTIKVVSKNLCVRTTTELALSSTFSKLHLKQLYTREGASHSLHIAVSFHICSTQLPVEYSRELNSFDSLPFHIFTGHHLNSLVKAPLLRLLSSWRICAMFVKILNITYVKFLVHCPSPSPDCQNS